jgi:2'-5' RNA ligase
METYPAMVALYPDEATKELITRLTAGVEGAYNPDDLHCTIVFLGDEYPNEPWSALNALNPFGDKPPFLAEVSAQVQFGPEYCVLLVDGKGIAELYTDVSRALDESGNYNASEHGFCAHMSIVTGQPEDLGALQLPLVFDRLVLAIGPYRYEIR